MLSHQTVNVVIRGKDFQLDRLNDLRKCWTATISMMISGAVGQMNTRGALNERWCEAGTVVSMDMWTRSANSFENYAGKYTAGSSANADAMGRRDLIEGNLYQKEQKWWNSRPWRQPRETKDGMATVARDIVQAIHSSGEGRDDPSLCIPITIFIYQASLSFTGTLLFSNSYPSELQHVKASRIDIDVQGDRKTESLGWSLWLTKADEGDLYSEHMIKSNQFQTQIKQWETDTKPGLQHPLTYTNCSLRRPTLFVSAKHTNMEVWQMDVEWKELEEDTGQLYHLRRAAATKSSMHSSDRYGIAHLPAMQCQVLKQAFEDIGHLVTTQTT
ncbi:hypothetical protein EV421DRAFT_1734761 [Armillaria borealis]|uniref:Uncharacterized protein n=1 Tax=Armillaria borealis TaxID=47425 RepID=A0AA39JNJ1_9AGAR|nr:hypothetical protein EV421DRAFT_1734761 [Armillaria borealis]